MGYPVIDGTVFDDTAFRHTVQDTARRDSDGHMDG
jgi:hypothetical protein